MWRSIEVDRTVPEVVWCTPGEKAGRAALTEFLSRLGKYAKERNNPSLPGERCSGVPLFHQPLATFCRHY
jgi:deoxyribodipyrimidine photolyase